MDSPISEPKPDEVIIQVVVSGCNPKPQRLETSRHKTFHNPKDTSLESTELGIKPELPLARRYTEAAAVPLAGLTAALGLYAPVPLVIYGAASAVGVYAVQFAASSNIHSTIAVAGKSIAYVEKFIDRSKSDPILDFQEGDDAKVKGIEKVFEGTQLLYALGAVMAEEFKVAVGWPSSKEDEVPSYIAEKLLFIGSAHKEDANFGYMFCRYLGRGLQAGWFKPQPQEMTPGGLNGIK
ncbi:hypothetical protein B0J13DRAFT_588460 [Dactylonectria estremocensis]|uniref:Alcohol dehydrogenase-like C-terminal domain-containing protein n=1 Tax=Dactylonectria estremocensis TaxID=1079267 RepID=A0A9P9IQN6_9HYPO|nr:hypothetical protein B0J13DRAFT_588460 [Dactylonectria estremocensis]